MSQKLDDRTSIGAPGRLPRHQRRQPTFAGTFGQSHDVTIAAMDRAGDDVANQFPGSPIRLPRIGVTRTAIPVTLSDPFDQERSVQVACTVEAYASLDADRRGIHVSRVGDLLAQMSLETFSSLSDYAAAVCSGICEGQGCPDADVRVGGVLSYLEQVASTREKASIEHLELLAGATQRSGRLTLESGLGFNHLTACPCVQQTFKHSLGEKGRRLLDEMRDQGLPALTHSQRCRTTVTISGAEPPPLAEFLECIDQVVVRCHNTMPRELELLTVYRTHARPQFVEDALRDLLRALHERIGSSPPAATITIRATSMESIHDFDISGEITCSVAELDRMFST